MQTSVKPFMTGGPISIEPDAPALAALDLMIEHGFRHLPVLDAQRRVLGVVSFDDLRAAFPVPISLAEPPSPAEHESMRDLTVSDAMTEAPFTVTEDTSLAEAAQQMLDHRISSLPVVDATGSLDGILTETDLLRALVTAVWTEDLAGDAPPISGRSLSPPKETT